MDQNRKKILNLELQAVQSARYSNNLDLARAAIQREEELVRQIAEEEAGDEDKSVDRARALVG